MLDIRGHIRDNVFQELETVKSELATEKSKSSELGSQVAKMNQGCNSIDILNLRLDLGRKLRHGLRMRLGMRFLAVG